jgi:LAO/AO transport system kinase
LANPSKLLDLRNKADIASALSAIEQDLYGAHAVEMLDEAFAQPKGTVIGITGPPGAGKSTLINVLIGEWRKSGSTVAVLAVDPSSAATRGALLGDRVRMRTDPADAGVFVRSIASRGRLGGLADIAYPSAILLRALYDKVVVESVGVGQSETDIANVADTVVLCIQPGAGDSLQFMKAGIAEIPDVAAVTKADMGAIASRALADLKGALGLAHRGGDLFETQCLAVSAASTSGMLEFLAALSAHEQWLLREGRLATRRRAQAQRWLEAEIVTYFGRKGLELAKSGQLQATPAPFATARKILSHYQVVTLPSLEAS